MQDKNQQINALIELNDDLENYFRNTIIPQLFVDANLILRKFTPPAMKQFKLRLNDVGKSITDIKDNFRFPSLIENIQQVIDTHEILEKEIQTTDRNWYQMNIIPYLIKKKKSNGVIITFVDISARIRDLREQEKLIAEHELLLDTISHDIKTPLTSLGLTIEMLKRIPEKGMERFPTLLEKVENSLVKIKDVIYELTDSRKSDHRYQATEELLNFEHILEDVRLTLAPQIFESEAVISCEVCHSEILFVRRKLRSILYNLISNAIKYQDPNRKPKIVIEIAKESDFIILTVSDNGRGIAKDDIERIFTKYERISNEVDGSGIGLYLVREIIQIAGGKITAESELGKGTTFKVYFKVALV
ncbi:ATP-binding protein [Pedobacter agri]|uniref:sensor histidine kinase n=1 Tax=Pedobacter agri TaxID=454586 RepID=UPI002930AFF4|nr:ATP-binding protein [Pedobacter agri]